MDFCTVKTSSFKWELLRRSFSSKLVQISTLPFRIPILHRTLSKIFDHETLALHSEA